MFRGTVVTIEGRNVEVRDVSRRVAECQHRSCHRPDIRYTVVVARLAGVGWRARFFRGDEKDFQKLKVLPLPRQRGSFGGLLPTTDQAAVAQ
jgi:hypothetical protein